MFLTVSWRWRAALHTGTFGTVCSYIPVNVVCISQKPWLINNKQPASQKKKTLQKPLVAACTFTRLDEITPTVSDLLKKKKPPRAVWTLSKREQTVIVTTSSTAISVRKSLSALCHMLAEAGQLSGHEDVLQTSCLMRRCWRVVCCRWWTVGGE